MLTVLKFVGRASGWPRRLLALIAGALSVLALAPFFFAPILLLTLPVLVWQIDASAGSDGRSAPGWRRHPLVLACGAGWWFGFGYFLAGLFWIGEAFLVEVDKFAVFMPLAVTLMPAGLALFWAAAAVAAAALWRPGIGRIAVLAVTLAAAEWLRGHVFTGLPWNLLGYALTWPLPLMQSAAAIGIYGLTLIAVPLFAAPAVIWTDAAGEEKPDWRRFRGVVATAAALAVLMLLGSWRLSHPEPPPVEGVHIRLVQPSVPQREKWRPENQERIFRELQELSLRPRPQGSGPPARTTLIAWPEAAMPFLPLSTPAALDAIGRMLPDNAYLATGALRMDEASAGVPAGRRRFFNSLMIFGSGGRLLALYDKIHLVPFGEYLPLQATLEAIGLEQLTRIRGGFDAGVEPRPVLGVAGLPPLGPLICYEAVFPRAIVQGERRPGVLLNVTNDGWFGQTTGPHQHMHQARVRAVEEGLPMLRVANNGISAVIDAKGRVLHRLGLNVKGVIDSALPAAIERPLYARYGDWIFALMLGIWAMGWALAAMDGRRRRRSGI